MARNRFSYAPQATIPRAVFDRSHSHKTTINERKLWPLYVDEALPGDTFRLRMTLFARLATPLKPVMDNLWIDSHFFAVPCRLLWDNWEEFISGQGDHVIPQIAVTKSTHIQEGRIFDQMGIPIEAGVEVKINALYNRAYNMIWNEWFRDQNLQDEFNEHKDDGPDPQDDYFLGVRNKRHDYFTSCLPWPQKGDAVNIPLGISAPVVPNSTLSVPVWKTFPGDAGGDDLYMQTSATNEVHLNRNPTQNQSALMWVDSGLEADLTGASSVTINELREAFQLQKMLERDARGGSRYPEMIQAHFGVSNPDSRMQRPEYLGGGSTRVAIKPVEQTAAATEESPQGNLAAIGTAVMGANGFTRSFTEHCIVIGLVSTRSAQSYQFGLDRMYSRSTRYDYYWPALSHIGEQAVLGKEIWFDGTAGDDEVFGYQERFAEYRYKNSLITGQFRSNNPLSLDIWHLGQDYANRPVLGNTFIQERPPIDRISAIQTEPAFLVDAYFDLRCARPMPLYGVPGNIDRF